MCSERKAENNGYTRGLMENPWLGISMKDEDIGLEESKKGGFKVNKEKNQGIVRKIEENKIWQQMMIRIVSMIYIFY